MANNRIGFDYYRTDTDRYQDRRIKRLKKDFGCAGLAVYDYLLCEVYRVRGCFTEWDTDIAFDVAEYFGIDEALVSDIVGFCAVVGLFDRDMLTQHGIITSRSIQRRYIEMSARAKRKNVSIPDEVMLSQPSGTSAEDADGIAEISDIVPEECDIIPEGFADITETFHHTSANLTHSKEKQRKEKDTVACNDDGQNQDTAEMSAVHFQDNGRNAPPGRSDNAAASRGGDVAAQREMASRGGDVAAQREMASRGGDVAAQREMASRGENVAAQRGAASRGGDAVGNEGKSRRVGGFIPPTLEQMQAYFTDNGYSAAAACKAYGYYTAGNWTDSRGNSIRNWKQKCISVWFRAEYRSVSEAGYPLPR